MCVEIITVYTYIKLLFVYLVCIYFLVFAIPVWSDVSFKDQINMVLNPKVSEVDGSMNYRKTVISLNVSSDSCSYVCPWTVCVYHMYNNKESNYKYNSSMFLLWFMYMYFYQLSSTCYLLVS